MSRRIEEQCNCPYCGKYVVQSTRNPKSDSAYSLTRRKIKIWFHRSCYLEDLEVRGHRNEN